MSSRRVYNKFRKNLRRAERTIRFIMRHPIGRRNQLAALGRYLSFHLRHLIRPGVAHYKWIGNLIVLTDRKSGGMAGNLYVGLADFEEMGFMLHFLRAGDLFVDIGANVGAYSLLASGMCQAMTVAVEPVLATCNRLLEHVRRNGLDSLVEIHQVGVGSSCEAVFFTADLGLMNHVATDEEISTERDQLIRVPMTTLDNLIGGREPTLIKIYVEGYEAQVLQGAAKLLSSRHLYAVIMELQYGEDLLRTHQYLVGKGFLAIRYDPFRREFALLDGYRRDQFNTLYIRESGLEFVEERARAAPTVRVFGVEF